MKVIREIFARIWALWALVVFTATMVFFFIPFLLFCYNLPEPRRSHRYIRFLRAWMWVFLGAIGCPVRVRGREHFEKGKNYVVVCNHNSLIDVPVSTPSIPGGNKTIAKAEMAKIPVFGLLYKTGSVLVDRTSDQSRKQSFSRMKNVLAMGLHMCIYPEGTRNRTAEPVKAFHNGAFRLAAETDTPIIAGLIFNSRKVLPAGKFFYAMPHPLEIHFLAPIPPQPGESAEALKQRV